jgi:hypothetical protein
MTSPFSSSGEPIGREMGSVTERYEGNRANRVMVKCVMNVCAARILPFWRYLFWRWSGLWPLYDLGKWDVRDCSSQGE